MLKVISCQSQLSPMVQQYVKETAQPQPKHFCTTCTKLSDNKFCDCFQRRVEPDYNRCFNHSKYDPILVIFKTPKNLKEMMNETGAA